MSTTDQTKAIAKATRRAVKQLKLAQVAAKQWLAKPLEHSIDCGACLTELKKDIPPADWDAFIAAEMPFTLQEAEAYMRLAVHRVQARHLVETSAADLLLTEIDNWLTEQENDAYATRRNPASPTSA